MFNKESFGLDVVKEIENHSTWTEQEIDDSYNDLLARLHEQGASKRIIRDITGILSNNDISYKDCLLDVIDYLNNPPYSYFYKIKDTEDDEYSDYLATDSECKMLIENAVNYYYDYPDDDGVGGTNVFDYIEYFLRTHDINFKWIRFDDMNIIEF